VTILAAFAVPHPPIIIPHIGQGNEAPIAQTIAAYQKVARRIARLRPDTIVISSPHATLYRDYFHISPGEEAVGSFAEFGAPQDKFRVPYDSELTATVESLADAEAFPAGTRSPTQKNLDHGTMVPLHFVNEAYAAERAAGNELPDFKIMRVGLSGLPFDKHYHLGRLIARAAAKLSRRIVYIASGDLSHRLKKDGPYGFNSAGPVYDKLVMSALASASFQELFAFEEKLLENAAECGHRSFIIMAGALDGLAVKPERLSYEGPFGVGYGICSFAPAGTDASRCFENDYPRLRDAKLAARLAAEDAYVRLARRTIEAFVSGGHRLPLPQNLPGEMLRKKAGAFVSLHSHGQLRGCIGTINPLQENLAEEIRRNAIAAATEDPRFMPVQPDELSSLEYSVDILGPLEPVSSLRELNAARYGVVVSKGARHGLLLPALEGVDTPEQQVDIARRKAGIYPEEVGVSLWRFEVVRHA